VRGRGWGWGSGGGEPAAAVAVVPRGYSARVELQRRCIVAGVSRDPSPGGVAASLLRAALANGGEPRN
jgi:hypothetical protein